jgi:hypothetical protein
MLYGSASSILVCCRSIVASFLANVLCAARGDLRGWFASIAINETSSPGHDEQKLGFAVETVETKTSSMVTAKHFEERGIATLYNGQQKQRHAAFAVRCMSSQQKKAQNWDCHDVNIRGVNGVTRSSSASIV